MSFGKHSVGERQMLQFFLQEWDKRMLNGFIWLTIMSSVGIFEHIITKTLDKMKGKFFDKLSHSRLHI
jgi:hypothetical protein